MKENAGEIKLLLEDNEWSLEYIDHERSPFKICVVVSKE